MIIVKQKCIRLLNDIQTDKMAMEDLVKNNEKFVKKFLSLDGYGTVIPGKCYGHVWCGRLTR